MNDKFRLTPKEREELSFILQTFYVGKQDYDIAINAFEKLIQDRGNSIEETEWQKCPNCDGQGIVSRPPWIAGDVYEWSSTSVSHQCNVCNGAMIIPSPKQPKK